MKKKVTQETANRLRELLEKVTSEREDVASLPKNHQIARILLPLFALCFAGVYLQNAHAFSIIGSAFATIFEVGVWETFEFVVTVTSFHFLTWSVPFIVLGFVFFWRRYSFKKEFNALVERAKEEITLGKKKPLETNRTLVKGLEGFLKSLQTEYQFEQKIREQCKEVRNMIYKTLLFDLDSTLWDFHSAENYALTKLLEQQGVEDVEAYIDVYVPMNRAMWRSLEKDEITREELVETRFAKLFDHFGFEKDGKELAADYEVLLSTQGQTYEGAEELLQALQDAGYDLYAATNGITTIQKGRLSNSPIAKYFKKVFISEEVGAQKPSEAFFERVAGAIPDYDKDKAVIIGDSLTADIQGGINAGIDTIWMNLAAKENKTAIKPTVEVRSYAELLEFLV